MKKFIFIISLMTCICLHAYAQQRNSTGLSLFNSKGSTFHQDDRKSSSPSGNVYTNLSNEVKEDIIDRKPMLFRTVVKRDGWFEGFDNISDETAGHLPVYFRLSKMNGAGHWTHIEALDGYNRLTTDHSIGAYALPKSNSDTDTTANAEWKEKIASICKWNYAYDSQGQRVVMERAYDANDNLIYAFTPVQINDSTFIGSYIDAWGRPANLRGEDGSSLVRLTRDERGFDVKVELLDELGNNIPNENDVIMTRYQYYDNGMLKSIMSCNIYGEYIIDRYGNCGNIVEYDENWLASSETSVGTDWKPLRVSNDTHDYVKHTYKYDDYGRLSEVRFWDENGEEDHNSQGLIRVAYEYENYYYPCWRKFYGRHNKLVNFSNGAAINHEEYDSSGYIVLQEFFNADSIFVNIEQIGACRQTWTFDESDSHKLVEQHMYQQIDDSLQEVYSYKAYGYSVCEEFSPRNIYAKIAPEYIVKSIKKPFCEKYYRYDGIVQIDSIDSHGNVIYDAYFHSNGTPALHGEGGYHLYRKNIDYKDDTGKNYVSLRQWYDCNGHSMNSIERKEVDTKSCTSIDTQYNLAGEVVRNEKAVYTDTTMTSLRSLFSLNDYGINARSLKNRILSLWGDCRNTDNTGKPTSYVHKNEFGEPAYGSNPYYRTAFYYYMNDKNDTRFLFDERGDSISTDNMTAFYNALPKAACVEVVDSIAYGLGFKDGDIIVKYGENWHYPLRDTLTNLSEFYFQQILTSNVDKDILVLRHHRETSSSEIVSLKLVAGTLSQRGIAVHEVCYTQRELERLQKTLKAYLQAHDEIVWKENIIRESLPHEIKFMVPYGFDGAIAYWDKHVRDPFIPLVIERQRDAYTPLSHDADFQFVATYDEPSQLDSTFMVHNGNLNMERRIYYSNNLRDIDSLSYYKYLGVLYYPINVSDDEFGIIENMVSQLENSTEMSMRQFVPDFLNVNSTGTTGIKPDEFMSSLGLPPTKIQKKGVKVFECTVPLSDKVSVSKYNELCKKLDFSGWDELGRANTTQIWAKKDEKGSIVELFTRAKNHLLYAKGKNLSIQAFNFYYGYDVVDSIDDEEKIREYLVAGIPQESGSFKKKGYDTDFILLRFNDWNMYNSLDLFGKTLQNCIGKEKHLLFIPVKYNGTTQKYDLGDIIEDVFSEKMLGVRFVDYQNEDLINSIIPIYEKWRKNNSYRLND